MLIHGHVYAIAIKLSTQRLYFHKNELQNDNYSCKIDSKDVFIICYISHTKYVKDQIVICPCIVLLHVSEPEIRSIYCCH